MDPERGGRREAWASFTFPGRHSVHVGAWETAAMPDPCLSARFPVQFRCQPLPHGCAPTLRQFLQMFPQPRTASPREGPESTKARKPPALDPLGGCRSRRHRLEGGPERETLVDTVA